MSPAGQPSRAHGLNEFNALELLEQAVLASLVLGGVPRPRTWVFEALAESTLRPQLARRPTQEQVRSALEGLARAGWASQDLRRSGYWQVEPAGYASIWAHVLDLAPVEPLRDLLARVDGYSALQLSRLGMPRMPSVEAAVARLRLEVVSGSAPEDLDVLTPRLPWGCQDLEGLIATVLAPLSVDACLADLHPGFQAQALLDALRTLNGAWSLPPDLDVLGHCRRLLASPDLSVAGRSGAMLRWTYFETLLGAGQFEEAQAHLLPFLGEAPGTVVEPALQATARILLCGLQAQQGQWEAAEQGFEAGLAVVRKVSGRRNGLFGVAPGTFYVLALLARQQPALWQKALKLCLAEGGSREPMLDRPWGLMALAIQMRLGEAPRDPAIFRPYTLGGQPQASPLDLWRWLMRAWLKEGAVPEPLSVAELEAARKLRQRLADAGLAGWGRQLDAALSVLAGERAPEWFFVRSARERWQVALDALQAVSQPAVARESGSATVAQTRLLWQLELNDHGAILGLEPLEQKQGVRGWGRPKPVPLSRLQKTVATLAPHDQAIARHIVQESYSRTVRLKLTDAVPALVGHPQVCFEDRPELAVEITEAGPELDVVREDRRVRVRIVPTLHVTGDEAQARWGASAAEQKELDTLRLYTIVRDSPQRARLIRLTAEQKRVAQLLGSAGLDIPEEGLAQLQEVLTGLGTHFRIHSDEGASAQASRDVVADARLRAELSPVGQGLQVRLVAAPFGPEHAAGGPRLVPGGGRARLVVALGGETLGVQRDLAAEVASLGAVLDACPMLMPPPPGTPCEWQLDDPEDALGVVERLHALAALQAVDWPQGKSLRVDRSGLSQLTLQVHTRQEWLAVQGELQVDEQLVLGLQQLVALAAGRNSRFVPLGEGRYLALTQELRERLDDLTAVTEGQTGPGNLAELRVPTVAAPWLQQVAQGAQVQFDEGFARRLAQLDEAQRVVPALPGGLQASLRPYQEEGYEWAMRLSHAGLGACLADDMGLGKTLQALAVLLARAPQGAALVVAPTSLMGNWRAEARRFAPSLKVRIHAEGGADRTHLLADDGPGCVVLVSYPMLQIDAEAFAARPWATLVLDEAQAIKNAAAKRSQAVFELQAGFRLALSGTPIENRLSELWSIMRACNPGLLGTLSRFNERFAGPIERQRDKRAQRQLRRLVAPFVLRRTKAEVLDDLPPRTELVLKVESDTAEQAHYEALRRDTLVAAERSLSGDAPGQAHLNILAGLTRLRRAACDPRLVSPHLGHVGAKVQAFGELAAELVANGHKALVFSQFVDFLALLKEPLDAAGIAYQYLDGSTPSAERTRRVDAFQAGQGELFLISLKAGGFGLNLTVADYVVIADPWWNPAVEDQASGRAHRMGQLRPVTVYRLVNQGTLEEKILTLHRDKRELADLLLEGTESAQLPRADELLALMRGAEPDGDEAPV